MNEENQNVQRSMDGRIFTAQDALAFLEDTLNVLDRVAADESNHPERRKLAANILEDFKATVKNRTAGVFDNETPELPMETKVTSCGGGGTIPAASPSPDLLNDLHTLRSLAHAVKTQADAQRLWSIAARCATISEDCTLAIEHFNAVNESHEQAQQSGDSLSR